MGGIQMSLSVRKPLATAAVVVVGVVGGRAATAGAVPVEQPIATVSCVNASTPGGTKCLAPGEYCSHKPGYAAAYRRAGFKCKRNGRLAYR
jgi:hypothetical protein